MNIHKYEKQIKEAIRFAALGYNESMLFAYGFIRALKENGLINQKEVNILEMVYASTTNENCEYSIGKDGKLKMEKEL